MLHEPHAEHPAGNESGEQSWLIAIARFLSGIVLGAFIVFLLWEAIFNFDEFVDRIFLAYIELWGFAVLLLPVWVIWLIAKKDK